MRWRRGRREPEPVAADAGVDPLILAVTEPVTRETAAGLVDKVQRGVTSRPVVIDLTAIPAFDSAGAEALAGLQESLGAERVTIVGLRQATARLVGIDDIPRPAREPDVGSATAPWVLRRLRAIVVVQTTGALPASIDGLEPVLTRALDEEVGIVVVDLRNVTLDASAGDVIAFASSTAAVHGQELLIVNVDAPTADMLRQVGLSATTYVAPQPLD